MLSYLKQSTAAQIRSVGPFVDDTDFKTAETGLTVANTDIKLSKNGASGVNKNSGGGTHTNNGMYSLTFDATDTSAVGELEGSISVSGALIVVFKFVVLEEAVYDGFFGASAEGYLQSTTAARKLDVTAAGNAGIDWGNVENKTTANDLSGTDIQLVDTTTTNTDMRGTDGVSLVIPDAAGVAATPAEVATALTDIHLDHLLAVDAADVAVNGSVMASLMSSSEDYSTFTASTDSLQAIRARGDAEWTTGAGGSDRLLMIDTTIATLASQTSFTLTAGSTDDKAYENLTIIVEDVATATQKATGLVLTYTGSTKTVVLKEALAFTITTTDKVYILAENSLKSTVANRQINVDANGRTDLGEWLGTPVTTSSTTAKPEIDVVSLNDDATAGANIALGWDGVTGVTGDTLPATQQQVGNISSGAGGLSVTQVGFTNTGGGTPTGLASDTETLNGVLHIVPANGGVTDFYYEFNVGVSGQATDYLWNGYVQSNGDTAAMQAYNWNTLLFEDVLSLTGLNGTTVIEREPPLPGKYTGTGANTGLVRLGFNSSTATNVATDRVLCVLSSVAAEALVFASGIAQSGGNNSIQLASGQVTSDDQFRRAKVITTGGTGAGQEAVITSSVALTDTLTVTAAWVTNPDSTTSYQVVPAQVHATVRNGGYDNGFIFVDTGTNGATGQEIGVNGTSTNPSKNLTDAYVIAIAKKTNKILCEAGSVVTLPSNSDNKTFEGDNYVVLLNGQEASGASFMNASLVGIALATAADPLNVILCGIGDVTLPPTNGKDCGFFGTFTIGTAGSFTFGQSSTVFDLPFVIDFAAVGASKFHLVGWLGGDVEVRNMLAGDEFFITGNGNLTIASSCTAGTVTRGGNIALTNNGTTALVSAGDLNETKGDTFDASTDSLEANRNNIGTAGAGLTAINLPNQTMNITGDITGNLSGSVGSVTGAVGSVTGSVGSVAGNVDGSVGSVAGNVDGNVTGSVANVLGGIDTSAGTITTLDALDTAQDAQHATTQGLVDDLAIKKNETFSNFEFLMVLTSDHATPATGITVTGQRSINGGAFANVTGTIAEVSNGIYQFDALAADTNGDVITWKFSAGTADDTFVTFKTVG
jgi:hypothetical protein